MFLGAGMRDCVTSPSRAMRRSRMRCASIMSGSVPLRNTSATTPRISVVGAGAVGVVVSAMVIISSMLLLRSRQAERRQEGFAALGQGAAGPFHVVCVVQLGGPASGQAILSRQFRNHLYGIGVRFGLVRLRVGHGE